MAKKNTEVEYFALRDFKAIGHGDFKKGVTVPNELGVVLFKRGYGEVGTEKPKIKEEEKEIINNKNSDSLESDTEKEG